MYDFLFQWRVIPFFYLSFCDVFLPSQTLNPGVNAMLTVTDVVYLPNINWQPPPYG